MEFLRNTWYFAAWAENIAPGAMLARTIINEPIVLYRQADGAVGALEDRCPHRQAPLSMGKVSGDRIVCAYHGLEFDRSGACVHNPHGSGKIPAAARTRSYPLVEKHGSLWIWMGEQAADPARIPDFRKLDPGQGIAVTRRDYMVMDAPYDLITDNLLDLSHVNFLHDGILGNPEMIEAETEVKQEGTTITVCRLSRDVPPPNLFDMLFRQDGKNVDSWMDMRWDAPSCMLLDVGITDPGTPRDTGTGFFGTHILTPETDETTHYHFAATRWNISAGSETEEMRLKISDLRRFAFEKQDEPIIQAQHRLNKRSPTTKPPVMLEVDVGVSRWRRTMERLIAEEKVAAAPQRLSA